MKSLFQKSSIKSLLLNVLLVFALFSLLSFVFFYEYLPYTTNRNNVITVPDVRGQRFSTAKNLLTNRDLRIEVSTDSAYSSMAEPFTILEQYPLALAKVKVNRLVTVKLNAKIAPYSTFPDLAGSTPQLAIKQLKGLGISIGKLNYEPDIAVNSVLSAQINNVEVRGGDKVRMGSVVNLTIGMDSTEVTP